MKRNEASGSDKPRERGDEKDLDEWFKTKTRTGGAYIPPSRLKAMQKDQKDENSIEFQRTTWEALKKSINGLINKVRPFPPVSKKLLSLGTIQDPAFLFSPNNNDFFTIKIFQS